MARFTICIVTDFIAFDDAVKVAVDFPKLNKETLVLTSDHDTVGLKMGNF
jgi:alkaline phosphatase